MAAPAARKTRRATTKDDVTITMTEPVHCDFRFESGDTAKIMASYTAP